MEVFSGDPGHFCGLLYTLQGSQRVKKLEREGHISENFIFYAYAALEWHESAQQIGLVQPTRLNIQSRLLS